MPDSRRDRYLEEPPRSFKPIVHVEGVAYRVTPVARGEYEVVRIVDDHRLGTFRILPTFEVTAAEIQPEMVRQIAALAASAARPSWTERLARAWQRRTRSGVRRIGED